jgi:uroporphyrinogen-III synthase
MRGSADVERPLSGRRIVVTRRPGQNAGLASRLRDLGATIVEIPSIDIVPPEDVAPLDAALRALSGYSWVTFTSANAVRAVAERLSVLELPGPLAASGPQAATVGPSTREAFRGAFPGAPIGLEPEGDFRAAGLLRAFAEAGIRGQRVFLPVSDRARDELAKGLRELGAQVDVVVSYRTVEPEGLRSAVERCLAEGYDLLTFASPSAVSGFVDAAGGAVVGSRAAVIGPTTEEAALAAGLRVVAVAEPKTVEGLVAAVVRALAAGSAPRS